MGSLVMSQVHAPPAFAHHQQQQQQHVYYNPRMVGGDSPHTSDSDPSARSQTQQPSEPTLRPSSHQSSHITPASTTRPSVSRTASSHSAHPESNHRQGFDQSGFPLSSDPRGLQSSPNSPRLQPTYRSTRSLGGSEATSPSRLRVRDLAHIQSFASQEYLRPRLGPRSFEAGRQYEISSMPVADIIEMVAGLLTRITTTNDRQHEHLQRPITPQEQGTALASQANCVLAFHGKNVPSITILSYLSRIHKYCPTTYEVFLSLLVYFDRMTDNFNKRIMQSAGPHRSDSLDSHASSDTLTEHNANEPRSPMPIDDTEDDRPEMSQVFVVDSYNIHRLVIAGVTCASKFFSDVFYTNSRYAKVGGLPLAELNNLELQFLILNDFRLSVPVEELDAYGTMLVEFYAREVVAQQQAADAQHQQLHSSPGGGDEVYMQGSARPQPVSS